MNIEPKILNPICIRLDKKSSALITDEKNYELGTGVMFSNEHYGLDLIINHNGIQREIIYPTQNRIDAVGIEGDVLGDLKIFENGKYYPWLFSYDGKLKKDSSYNPYSRRDVAFIEDCYGLNDYNSKYCFTLQKKK